MKNTSTALKYVFYLNSYFSVISEPVILQTRFEKAQVRKNQRLGLSVILKRVMASFYRASEHGVIFIKIQYYLHLSTEDKGSLISFSCIMKQKRIVINK